MNMGELKLQNFFFNSQLQLNKDLFSSNESVSSFDNILKNKTIERSEVGRETDYKGFTNATMDKNMSVKVNEKRSDFSPKDGIRELKESIREGIAQKKFERENDALPLGQELSEKVKSLRELQKQIKELEQAIKKELGSTDDAETLEAMAMMIGVDVEVLIQQLTQGTMTSEEQTELVDQIVEFVQTEDVNMNQLVKELQVISEKLPSKDLVEFEKVLEEIMVQLPEGDQKQPVKEFVSELKTIMEQPEVAAVKVDAEAEVVQTTNKEVVKQSVEQQVITLENTDEKVQVVETKSEAPKEETLTSQEQKPILSLEVKTETKSNAVNFEEQLNVMKTETSVISSAKSQPRAVLSRSVMNQVVQGTKMSINMADQGSEILIKLNPKNLGNVALKMAFDKGELIAQIQVENQTVKGIIESNLDDLRDALKEEGYAIGDLDVSVNKENSGQQEQSFSQQFKKQMKHETFEEVEERLLEEKNLANDKEINYLA